MCVGFMLCVMAHQSYCASTAVNKLQAAKKSAAMLVTMPSAEILAKRLRERGVDHFMGKTRLHEKLGGQQKYLVGVLASLETALSEYEQDIPLAGQLMAFRRNELLEALLKDFPDALNQLYADFDYLKSDA